MLSDSDLENADRLYILTNFKTSIEVQSFDFRVRDIFSYQDNKISVKCDYQTLLDYFYDQVELENTEINEGELSLKKWTELTSKKDSVTSGSSFRRTSKNIDTSQDKNLPT